MESLEQRDLLAPTLLDPNLAVRPVVSGLTLPIGMAFLRTNDILVVEKDSGQVKRVVNGTVQSTVLDLAVNNFSERGLLSIALHPDFFDRSPATLQYVYLYWTESTTGADTSVPSATPLLGNRVDRFIWNGSTLTMDRNIIRLRAIQQDAGQPERGNHDGGVLRFGPDEKLYVYVGDVGRRGQLQNLPNGPFGPGMPDDQFGGPQPDDEHLTGVILRLNPDGTAPRNNPFFRAGATMGGEVGANVQKIFAYGFRNGFGMAFDPVSGALWEQENGDDSFSEINRVTAGMNGGWVQIAGPVSRIAQFKQIETTFTSPTQPVPGLQQVRWPPSNIADTPQEALARLFRLPGSSYSDPEFSWKFEVAPGGIGFLDSRALGAQYRNDLFVGAATPLLEEGYLFRFNLTSNRRAIAVDDPRLRDLVADNVAKHDITESESLLFGRGFGVVTDVQTGPNGNLFVVSLSDGTIYEIFRSGSPTAQIVVGVLVVTGSTGNDILTVGRSGSDIVVRANGQALGSFDASMVQSLRVEGGDGNDIILVASNITLVAELRGGRGNDFLRGGSGNDRIFGEEGRDILFGMAGDDLLDGGDGLDSAFGGPGQDTMIE